MGSGPMGIGVGSRIPPQQIMQNFLSFMRPGGYHINPAEFQWGVTNNMPGHYGAQPNLPIGAPLQQAPGGQSPTPMPVTQPTATPNPAANMFGGKGPGSPIGTGM